MGVWDFINSCVDKSKQYAPIPISIKNACWTGSSYAFKKVDQVVRVDGLQRLYSFCSDTEGRATIFCFMTKLPANADSHVVNEGVKLLPDQSVVMGVWNFINSSVDKSKQYAPIPISIKNACWTGSSNAVKKVDQVVRVDGVQRLYSFCSDTVVRPTIGRFMTKLPANAGSHVVNEGVKLLPDQRVVMGVWNFTNSSVDKSKQYAPIPISIKNACWTGSSYAVKKVDQVVRVDGVQRLYSFCSDTVVRATIGRFMTKLPANAGSHVVNEGDKLLPVQRVVMGVWNFINSSVDKSKQYALILISITNACWTGSSYAVKKVDQVVRVDGVQRLYSFCSDTQRRATIGRFMTKLAANVGSHVVKEGVKLLPGGEVVSKIISKTMRDMESESKVSQKRKIMQADVGEDSKARTSSIDESQLLLKHETLGNVIQNFIATEFFGPRIFTELMVTMLHGVKKD